MVNDPGRYLRKCKPSERFTQKMTSQVMAFIDAIIEGDKKAHRKQRHTGKRIWERVVDGNPRHRTADQAPLSLYLETLVRRHDERKQRVISPLRLSNDTQGGASNV